MEFNLTSEEEYVDGNDSFGANDTFDDMSAEGVFESGIVVPLYIIIFLLSVIGNSLVLITLGRNKRMRTVTNVYLLNLAVADLLLGVFCMPFTLIGQILRNFIFGSLMCKLIPYFQAVSVSVGVWTLVVISLERYFAICRPLKSRTWQTEFHAYKMITCVWVCSLVWTSPILIYSRLRAIRMGRQKCREVWPNRISEKVYNIFLDSVLLLVPVFIMGLAYSLIVTKLWRGLQDELKHSRELMEECLSHRGTGGDPGPSSSQSGATGPRRATVKIWLKKIGLAKGDEEDSASSSEVTLPVLTASPRSIEEGREEIPLRPMPASARPESDYSSHVIRSNYMDRSIEAKKKVIRMLFVVVAEFFICWAPLHVVNTWYLFAPELLYEYVGPTGISLVQLLAYISSCCNPITYCFMNRKFRQAFFSVFTCCPRCAATCGEGEMVQRPRNIPVPTSDMSGNESTTARAAAQNRSELETLELEDRV